jgi:Uma2 family endonuclease
MLTSPLEITRKEREATRISATYADYLGWEPENAIVEWKDGEIITYMPPTGRHQDLLGFLTSLLDQFIDVLNLGALRHAPFEVKLWPDGPSREPDILFTSNERLDQLTEKRYLGAPDLVVEVISTSSARSDRVEKFIEYERAGVREYWVIDPRPGQQQAKFYQWSSDGRFFPVALDEGGIYHSLVLPDFWLHPDWLREGTLPPATLKMAEIVKDLATLPDDVRAAYRALYEALTKVNK